MALSRNGIKYIYSERLYRNLPIKDCIEKLSAHSIHPMDREFNVNFFVHWVIAMKEQNDILINFDQHEDEYLREHAQDQDSRITNIMELTKKPEPMVLIFVIMDAMNRPLDENEQDLCTGLVKNNGICLDFNIKNKKTRTNLSKTIDNAIYCGYGSIAGIGTTFMEPDTITLTSCLPKNGCQLIILENYSPGHARDPAVNRVADPNVRMKINLPQAPENQTLLDIKKRIDFPVIDGEKFSEIERKFKETKCDKKFVSYYGIALDPVQGIGPLLENETVQSIMKKDDFKIIMQNKFHLTVEFINGTQSMAQYARYSESVGKKIDLECLGIGIDGQGFAVLVDRKFFCDNYCPHITLGTGPGTRPVYCNALLEGAEKNRTFIQFDKLIVLNGTFKYF
jgi:hypothetical protein